MPRIFRSLLLLAAGTLCAGALGPQQPPEPARTPLPGEPHNTMKRALRGKTFAYTCANGVKLSVYLGDSLAKILFQGHRYLMRPTQSADGSRYSDGKVLWWGKGEGGFLQQDAPDGDGKMLAKDCKLDKPAEAETTAVKGTITYLPRIALPPNAVIDVRLEDVSEANLPPKTIAERKITLGDRQLPVLFEVPYDPAKIDPRHSYALSANVLVDGEVHLTNEESYPVLTLGHSSHVDVLLKEVLKEREKKQP